jgi:hypothetical protein
MTPMPTDLMLELRDVFATYFNEEGLTDFALALGVDYENLSGSTKSAKSRELALLLWRHSLLPKLATVGPRQRPDIDWAGILGKHLPEAATEAVPETPKLNFTDLQKLMPILADYPMFQTPDGRRSVLTLSGIEKFVNVDLNGSARLVASGLLVQLNDYGRTPDDDIAVVRLLNFLADDNALPPAHKSIITTTITKFN